MKRLTRQCAVTLGVFCLIACLVLLAMPSVLSARRIAAQTSDDLFGVRVAVYNGCTLEASNNSRIAVRAMFQWMAATVEVIEPEEIRAGGLADYDMIVMPGIPTSTYSSELGATGMDQIRQFVANGGSYMGICGGSILGQRGYLGLFDGSLRTPIPNVEPGTHLTQMNVNHESTGPNLAGLPATFSVLYWNSGYWYADDMSGIITVASYPTNNQPGMIASRYGYGTYFLSSPHPEWEEGSARDGTTYFDELNDPDSEWPMLLSVARWLIDASPAPPPSSTPGPNLSLIGIAAAGGVIGAISVVAVVIVLKRR